MFSFVLVTVFIIFKLDATHAIPETAEFRLRYDDVTNTNFEVWKDQALQIKIENGLARYIWCFNKYVKSGGIASEPFVPETEFANNIVNILNITKVTAEMSTRWVCTVLQEYLPSTKPYAYKGRNYTAKDLHFNVFVKGARQVILTANSQNVKYDVNSNLSVEYDGVANYTYEDGEDVEISCRKSPDDTHPSDTVRLEYFNAEGILLFQSKPVSKTHTFRSILNYKNDKYYLDCICDSINPVRNNRYRTIFYMKKDAEEHAIKLSINGQKLTTFLNNDTSTDFYIFRYIYGERLNITCQENHSFPKGTIFISFENETHRSGNPKDQALGKIQLKLVASNVSNKTVICGINNTVVQKPIAKILLFYDHDVHVRGLPRNNVLYQYTNDLDQWTIEYQYSLNDTLNLICVANNAVLSPILKEPHFQWEFGGHIIKSPAKRTSTLSIIKTSDKFTSNLDANHNGTKIKCTYFPRATYDTNTNKSVEIILRLKPEQSEVAKKPITDETESKNSDNNLYGGMTVLIAAPFGVVVAIVTMVCVICWHKRTKRANLIENAYDNLSNQNDSPIPAFPSQWESNYDDSHYASIDEDVMQENYNYSTGDESSYKIPYKRASNISENHYTEIDDYFKPKTDGLAANWNSAQPSNYKNTSAIKETASHNSNNASYNNSQGTSDKLMYNNLPINKDNEKSSTVQSKGKNKSVTFRQMSNDLRRYNEDNPRHQCRSNDQRLKQNNDGQYANADMQPGVMQKKYYENNYLKTKETVDSSDLDYAEPYGDLRISGKK